jgi:hypothetical protein
VPLFVPLAQLVAHWAPILWWFGRVVILAKSLWGFWTLSPAEATGSVPEALP